MLRLLHLPMHCTVAAASNYANLEPLVAPRRSAAGLARYVLTNGRLSTEYRHISEDNRRLNKYR
jgi:hypothetical protein